MSKIPVGCLERVALTSPSCLGVASLNRDLIKATIVPTKRVDKLGLRRQLLHKVVAGLSYDKKHDPSSASTGVMYLRRAFSKQSQDLLLAEHLYCTTGS